ncbi:MAG: hypothetical protein Q7W38_04225, partial [Deltaproteobacteria bacterium]|nr:hypothetical protein [Deltaproteobacteria bacterium]
MNNHVEMEPKVESPKIQISQDEEVVRKRALTGPSRRAVTVIAVCFSLFQIITGYFPLIAMYQRIIHVAFAFSLIFLLYPISPKQRKDRISWDGIIFVGLLLYISFYVATHFIARAGKVGLEPPMYELFLGGALIFLTLEASRRATGWALPIFCVGSLLYARFGEWLPVVLGHPNYDVERIISGLFMTTEGIYGGLTGISATFIFLFVL